MFKLPPLVEIRHSRNLRLQASDWTQLPDAALTQSQREQWQQYRQNLRDIMTQLPDPVPDSHRVTWPSQPSD